MKRTLSLILSLLMVFSLFTGLSLSAAEVDAVDSGAEAEVADIGAEAEVIDSCAAEEIAGVGAGADIADAGDYDYTDPNNPYLATDFDQLKTVFEKERTSGTTIYIKLARDIIQTRSNGYLTTNGADVEFDLSGYKMGITNEQNRLIDAVKGTVTISDSRRYDSSKQEWIDGRLEYRDSKSGSHSFSALLQGDIVLKGGIIKNNSSSHGKRDSAFGGRRLTMYGGVLEASTPIYFNINTWYTGATAKSCELYGGTLRVLDSSGAAIYGELLKYQCTASVAFPKISGIEIVNATGSSQVTAIVLIPDEEVADTFTYSKMSAFYGGMFPAGTEAYIDGYKMASPASTYRYVSGVNTVFSSLYTSTFRIVIPEVVDTLALTIPEPVANATITYNASVPESAVYELDKSYGDSNFWSRGVCWTRKGYIGPMSCHLPFDFLQGKGYIVELALKSTDKQKYPFEDIDKITATVNGHTATVTDAGGGTYILSWEFFIPSIVSSFALNVTEPKAGEQASYSGTTAGAAHYSIMTSYGSYGSTIWKNGMMWRKGTSDLDNNPAPVFEEGGAYTVFFMIVPKNDEYVFADLSECTATVNGNQAKLMKWAENQYIVYYTYNLKITVKSVSVSVTVPQAGAHPTYHASVTANKGYMVEKYNSEVYQNGVAWYKQDGSEMTPEDVFTAGKSYSVTVSLVPSNDEKYVFATSGITGTVNGESAVTGAYSSSTAAKNIYIEYTFRVVDKEVITDVYITVPDCITGGQMQWTASAPEGADYEVEKYSSGYYGSGVYWLKNNSSVTPGKVAYFEDGVTYKVYVRIQPKDPDNFQFAETDQLKARVNGNIATVNKTLSGGNYYLIYSFTASSVTTISAIAVTIPEPKAGEKLSYSAALPGAVGYKAENLNAAYWKNGVRWATIFDGGFTYEEVADEPVYKAGGTYKMYVSLELTDDTKYRFADEDNLYATVNGKQAVVRDWADGTYGIMYTFDIPESSYILGDVDGDGDVTILDATAIQRVLAGLETGAYDEAAADADADGEVSILDVTEIQRSLAGLSSNSNIGKAV